MILVYYVNELTFHGFRCPGLSALEGIKNGAEKTKYVCDLEIVDIDVDDLRDICLKYYM